MPRGSQTSRTGTVPFTRSSSTNPSFPRRSNAHTARRGRLSGPNSSSSVSRCHPRRGPGSRRGRARRLHPPTIVMMRLGRAARGPKLESEPPLNFRPPPPPHCQLLSLLPAGNMCVPARAGAPTAIGSSTAPTSSRVSRGGPVLEVAGCVPQNLGEKLIAAGAHIRLSGAPVLGGQSCLFPFLVWHATEGRYLGAGAPKSGDEVANEIAGRFSPGRLASFLLSPQQEGRAGSRVRIFPLHGRLSWAIRRSRVGRTVPLTPG